jgi:hypothetical protein
MPENDGSRANMISWATGPSVDLTEAQEQLIEEVVDEVSQWKDDRGFMAGYSMRRRWRLNGVVERMTISVMYDNGEPEARHCKIRVTRPSVADASMTLYFVSGARCMVLDVVVPRD